MSAPAEKNIAAVLPAIGSDLVLEERPIPTPGPKDVLIRHSVVGINPIDRVRQLYGFQVPFAPKIIGEDSCGIVAAVGSDVDGTFPGGFRVGDRVVAITDGFSVGDNDRESYQTYALAPALTTAKLPDNLTLLEGSPVALVLNTAAVIFFEGFGIPIPSSAKAKAPEDPAPIVVVWGGASCVGTMAVQLGRHLGFTVYATASPRHHARLRALGASVVVDYAKPEAAVEALLAAAAGGGAQKGWTKRPILYGIDTVNDAEKTLPYLERLLKESTAAAAAAGVAAAAAPTLAYTNVLPDYAWIEGVTARFVTAADVWGSRQDIGRWLFAENLTAWLADGTFVPPRTRIVPGGLGGLQTALNQVMGGVSGEKLVVEVA